MRHYVQCQHQHISIHAPLAGCDLSEHYEQDILKLFQSTHPLRGATAIQRGRGVQVLISIHAPLAGCDLAALGAGSGC